MKKTPCFASFSYWGVHWLKLAPELKKVPGGKTTTHNILFEPILPNFEEIFEIGHDDFGGCPTLPVRKTVKLLISKEFRKDLSKYKVGRIFQHLALTVNLPDNYNDWDLGGGSVTEHQERRGQVLIENGVMIIIQAVFNMLMLIPIWVTGELTNVFSSCVVCGQQYNVQSSH